MPNPETLTTNLAVEYRPATFNDVAGQRSAVSVLAAAAEKGRPPQQLLLSGPSGTGKTTLARLFAAALFCPNAQDGSGCGTCDSCLNVVSAQRNHPDVIELDAASHGGVDQVRDLAKLANLAPVLAQHKVFIIDEAHGLTREGGQAFLRLLEEPPEHTIWILATTDPEKLPVALRGRCLQLPVNAPSDDEQTANIVRVAKQAGWKLSEYEAAAVVAATDEELGVRGAVTTLSKLAPLIGADGKPEPGAVEAVLNVADEKDIATLTAAILDGNVQQVGHLTQALLDHASPYVLRSQLLRAVRAELRTCNSEEQARKLARLLWQISEAEPNATALLVSATRSADGNARRQEAVNDHVATAGSADNAREVTPPGNPEHAALPVRSPRPEVADDRTPSVNDSSPGQVKTASDVVLAPSTETTPNPELTVAREPTVTEETSEIGGAGTTTSKRPDKREKTVQAPRQADRAGNTTSDQRTSGPFDIDQEALQVAARTLMSGAGGSTAVEADQSPSENLPGTRGQIAVADLLTHVAQQSARHAVALNKCRISIDGDTLTIVVPPHGPDRDTVQEGANMINADFTVTVVEPSAK